MVGYFYRDRQMKLSGDDGKGERRKLGWMEVVWPDLKN